MAALSLRLDPDLEMRLTQEVRRRNTTKTEFVQALLRQALEPKDPVDLLYALRSEHGLPEPQPDAPDATENSRRVKTLVDKNVRAKYSAQPAVPLLKAAEPGVGDA